MADPILLNQTIIEQTVLELSRDIEFLTRLFEALGGIFVLGVIFAVVSWIRQSQQKKMLAEINKKLDRLLKKR